MARCLSAKLGRKRDFVCERIRALSLASPLNILSSPRNDAAPLDLVRAANCSIAGERQAAYRDCALDNYKLET